MKHIYLPADFMRELKREAALDNEPMTQVIQRVMGSYMRIDREVREQVAEYCRESGERPWEFLENAMRDRLKIVAAGG